MLGTRRALDRSFIHRQEVRCPKMRDNGDLTGGAEERLLGK